MDFKKEVQHVVSELQSADNNKTTSSGLYGALIMMRTTLIKSKDAVTQLVKAGCVKMLLDLLVPPTAKGKWLKMVDIVLSILANLCLEEDVREEVISNKGLSIIVEATVSTETESIHNRGVRAVANLVQHIPQCNEVFDLELPTFVAKRLMETKEKECKLTYLRAVRLFGQTKGQVKKLIEGSRCIQAVASLLEEKDDKFKVKALRILSECSALRCCPAFVEQILAANVLEQIVQSAESTDSDISFFSLSVLFRLCEHENIRPPLGAAGLISTFMRLLDQDKSHINHVSIMNALCLCSKEAVNRHKLYQENTLELFVSALQPGQDYADGKFSVLHDRIISILINFIYNDECFVKLLDLGLVSVLMDHLERACDFKTPQHDWDNRLIPMSENLDNERDEGEIMCDMFGNKDSERDMNIEEICGDKELETYQNVDKTLDNMRLSKKFGHLESQDDGKDKGEKDGNTEAVQSLGAQIVVADSEDIDEEMANIEESTSLGTGSRHIFSIDSPTYQMEQHSWRLEDHTSGVTCKTFTSVEFEDLAANPKAAIDGGKFSPYSPLSAGASYYSPAYSSPANSLGQSPRYYSGSQSLGSQNLSSQSPHSSPAWSLASSSHLEDSSSDQGMSPVNLMSHTQTSHQGQFSPLINPYPASPPAVTIEERDLYSSPQFISQSSIVSNKSLDSQEDIFLESPKPSISFLPPHQNSSNNSRLALAHVELSAENQDPIYSASEEELEEVEEQGEKKEVFEQDKNLMNLDVQKGRSNPKDENVSRKKSGKEKIFHVRPEASSIESYEAFTDNSMHSMKFAPSKTTHTPFIRLNSDPYTGSNSSGNIQNSSNLRKDNSIEVMKAMKSSAVEAISANVQRERLLVNNDRAVPFITNTIKPFAFLSSSSLPSLSPFRRQIDFGSPSPSMSPFSRYSNSPYASPNPYNQQQRGDKSVSLGSESKGVTKSDMTLQKNTTSPLRVTFGNNTSNFAQPSENVALTASNEATNDDSVENNERMKKILRTTESNILILLSRISIKINPTPYLVKFSILSTLTSYLGISLRPFQRAIRTLSRLFNNPLCFESLLLEQAPALIVKNLILDQDGSFPALLLKDTQRGSSGPFGEGSASRKIHFDEMFPSSQSSDTASEFGLKMDFEFGGDAYSRIMSSSSCQFPPGLMNRSLSIDSQCARDNPEVYTADVSDNVEDRIKWRVGMGINLMKVLTSLALSKYGDGEIQRLWVRGTKSDRFACSVSLLHMALGCGPLHRRQIAFKHGTLHEVLPVLFVDRAPFARESIVTSLCLLAHLLGITKKTPVISKLRPCPDWSFGDSIASLPATSGDFTDDQTHKTKNNPRNFKEDEINLKPKQTSSGLSKTYVVDVNIRNEILKSDSVSNCEKVDTDRNEVVKVDDEISCVYDSISVKHDLNLIVVDDRSGERKVFRACKEILMRRSDVFSAMLGGSYAEADKVDIEFSDVGFCGFEYIMHYLHGCQSGCVVIDAIVAVVPVAVANVCCDISHKNPSENVKQKDRIRDGEDVLRNTLSNSNTHLEKSGMLDDCIGSQNLCQVSSVANGGENSKSKEIVFEIINSDKDVLSEEYEIQTPTITTQTNIASSSPSPLLLMNATGKNDDNNSDGGNDNNCCENDIISPPTLIAVNEDIEDPLTKHLFSTLDKCIDILTVADRFLLHDITKHVTSVLSHHCLCPSTCQDILCIASHYKLENLASDCVLEILLSQIPRKDIAQLFLHLGLDSGIRETVSSILLQLFTKA